MNLKRTAHERGVEPNLERSAQLLLMDGSVTIHLTSATSNLKRGGVHQRKTNLSLSSCPFTLLVVFIGPESAFIIRLSTPVVNILPQQHPTRHAKNSLTASYCDSCVNHAHIQSLVDEQKCVQAASEWINCDHPHPLIILITIARIKNQYQTLFISVLRWTPEGPIDLFV
ncbi:hypothetical protein BJ165DRAFT_1446052 [Panaeolus papilionaceus]|nr:hypothetical protein BJ165DRAFT_1446052 [Panaeolus papilionaceus]